MSFQPPTQEELRAFRLHDDPEEPWIGECDYCSTLYETASGTDHCGECGNCWTHCICSGFTFAAFNWLPYGACE